MYKQQAKKIDKRENLKGCVLAEAAGKVGGKCGTKPVDVVPSEHYVKRLWEAPYKTLENSGCGVGSDLPEGEGGALDPKALKECSAAALKEEHEEGGRGAYSMSERTTKWGPWSPESANSRPVQHQPCRLQSANRGSDSWADWAREVRNSQPEYRTSSSSTWHASAGGAHAWERKWDTQSSDWARSSRL